MKLAFQIIFMVCAMLLLATGVVAQQPAFAKDSLKTDKRLISRRTDLTQLQNRKKLLEERLSTLSAGSREHELLEDWIRELGELIETLRQTGSPLAGEDHQSQPLTLPDSGLSPSPERFPLALPAQQVFTEPAFKLSRPIAGATNEASDLTLAWTEDHPCPNVTCEKSATYTINKFLVEIANDKTRLPNNRLAKPVFSKEVVSDGGSAQSVKVQKDTLRSGQKYYWQVLVEYVSSGGTLLTKLADNVRENPQYFKTEAQTFDAFERRGFSLQRAVSGDEAAEGAQFGFLKTFKQKSVYTGDFAIVYNRRLKQTQRTGIGFQASTQGNLTSDESESEDAWQFRAGAIIDRNLKRNTINHLYLSLGAKYEADKKFKVGKLISENMLTPTLPALGIGIPFGRSSDPVQFRWRPYFYFDVGRTLDRGNSSEVEAMVLRLTPRIYTRLTLNFLRRALNLNDTFVFADDYFYALPLEKTKKRHNMFTSGFVLQVTKDFGFGLTYKSGEAAPKFKPVHTFGGVLTIRFAAEE